MRILGESLRGGCDSVTGAAPALPVRAKQIKAVRDAVFTHLSSSFATLKAPSLSLTTTALEPEPAPRNSQNWHTNAGAQHADVPLLWLMSANTNFHRRGFAAETFGDA